MTREPKIFKLCSLLLTSAKNYEGNIILLLICFKLHELRNSCGKFQVLDIFQSEKKVEDEGNFTTYPRSKYGVKIRRWNLSRSKDNQTIKIDWLLEYVMRNEKYTMRNQVK